jgi:hypothetical protein
MSMFLFEKSDFGTGEKSPFPGLGRCEKKKLGMVKKKMAAKM